MEDPKPAGDGDSNFTEVVLPVPEDPKPDESHDRLTGVLNLYHESHAEEPVAFEHRFASMLDQRGIEPYWRRRGVVYSNEPRHVDFGWIDPKDVGVVVIVNTEGMAEPVVPSEERVEEIRASILIVRTGPDDPGCVVRPGRFHACEPQVPKLLTIQAARGKVHGRVCVFPK